tara:strand:- start:28575 stop:28688 length:114 start_codon:yes stop_codon:yes gene_type:complete
MKEVIFHNINFDSGCRERRFFGAIRNDELKKDDTELS